MVVFFLVFRFAGLFVLVWVQRGAHFSSSLRVDPGASFPFLFLIQIQSKRSLKPTHPLLFHPACVPPGHHSAPRNQTHLMIPAITTSRAYCTEKRESTTNTARITTAPHSYTLLGSHLNDLGQLFGLPPPEPDRLVVILELLRSRHVGIHEPVEIYLAENGPPLVRFLFLRRWEWVLFVAVFVCGVIVCRGCCCCAAVIVVDCGGVVVAVCDGDGVAVAVAVASVVVFGLHV